VTQPPEEVVLAEPRGFCAGVDRAIEIVERAITKYGAPIYVRHEIVHNTYVVNDLKARSSSRTSPRCRPAPRWCSARTA
jgi:4-hydroxy-3-methylbut-2-en-1-yl diphosphate reductase